MTDEYARYDYAWKTPGWTVQNPVMPEVVDGYVYPGMPADVSLVRLYGKFMEMGSGRGLEGVLRLRLEEDLIHVPSGSLIPQGVLDKPLRFRHGYFSIYLPATNDPDLAPEFQYHARLTVRGDTKEFAFSLPAEVPEVNIMTLIPVS